MQLQFLGANNTVTGSKHLVRCGEKQVLIDCGLYQGLKVLRLRNWKPLPFDPATLDAVILTHAHIDHTGYLPVLVRNGFKGPIYATHATKALCELLLPDAGYLQEEDAAFANKRKFSKHSPALPLYTEADGRKAAAKIEGVDWETPVQLTETMSFDFKKAGHILGASFISFRAEDNELIFSGDLGRYDDLTMSAPDKIGSADYVLVESTYGNRSHPREDPEEILKLLIQKVIGRGGRLLIPAFAVGRSQQLLYIIWKLKRSQSIPDVPVYLNSPMAIQATQIFCSYIADQSLTLEECQGIGEMTQFVSSADESRHLNETEHPAIIISASGMATGGRVLHHLKKLAPDSKNAILFAGFQAAGTRGEAMLNGAEEIKIHGRYVPIRAEVCGMESLSAHADVQGIMKWLNTMAREPKRVFVTHGEPLASEGLRKRIQDELDWNCEVPDYMEIFDG